MDWFTMIKGFYEAQPTPLWTKDMVADAVVKGKLTPEQYKLITNEDYEAPTT